MGYTVMFTCSGGGLSAELRKRVLGNSRYNIKIIAVDSNDTESAKVFCNHFSIVPKGNEKTYVRIIADLVLKYKVNMVIPCSDEEALSLAKNREEIENLNCILACTNYKTLKIIANKIDTYKFLEKHNISTPKFYNVNSIDNLISKVNYFLNVNNEVVVKPAVGRGGRNVNIISNHKDTKYIYKKDFLDNYINHYKKLFPVIVMEKLVEPIYDVDILSSKGNLLRSVVRRRINPNMPNEGHIIENIKSLHSLAKQLSYIFELSWLYDCDVMLNEKGYPMVLEINPRPSGSLAVSVASGINFIEDMIAISKNEKLSKINIPDKKIIIPYTSLV